MPYTSCKNKKGIEENERYKGNFGLGTAVENVKRLGENSDITSVLAGRYIIS